MTAIRYSHPHVHNVVWYDAGTVAYATEHVTCSSVVLLLAIPAGPRIFSWKVFHLIGAMIVGHGLIITRYGCALRFEVIPLVAVLEYRRSLI